MEKYYTENQICRYHCLTRITISQIIPQNLMIFG